MNTMLSPVAVSLLVAAALAWSALEHGAGGFILMAAFLAVGLIVGRMIDGRIDARKFWDLLTGRRSSS
ncbi:hypothetical protein [Zhihengliuella flava]|uniref:DUF2273 domain-containing protein n=1 Tax=Zhihengliuella flava TaxID=1285193 RepID=A0A931DDN3_9MICC|nr:hypothetical protein [Zhihengliuella flava]MBG6084893.1 hypothetical protein [Zhihengliuella flava]